MKSAIARHILVKDKELAEQLKKKLKMVQILQKLQSNIQLVHLLKKVVN